MIEHFELSSDGTPVSDVDAAHWQDFVQELIPIGVSDLFFFDGEKVQLLAEDESDKRTLSEAVRNLLGTDIIEKLSADLNIYRSRAVQRAAAEDESASDLEALNNVAESLRVRRELAAKDSDNAGALVESLISEVQAFEQQLQEQGGSYARNRGKLEERKRQIGVRVVALECLIREQSHALLPVALAPKLLRKLLDQLTLEQDIRVGIVVDETLTNAAKAALTQLRKIQIKRGGKSIPLSSLDEFSAIAGAIKKTHQPSVREEDAIVHDLSNDQEQNIRGWAHIALESLPQSMKAASLELETLYREQQKVERDLARAPQDDVLQPLVDKLSDSRRRLAEAGAEAALRRAELEQASEARDRAESSYAKAVDNLATSNVQRHSLEKALRVQGVLTEFRNALITKKIKEVEAEVTTCFNLLSRKRIERTIVINPTTFQVTIRDNHSRQISKSELSAGEKQIYAISILWALARVSGRPLPMIIDTPLARLDRDHRELLGQRYFPQASHQVIILSTDSEIDAEFLPLLKDSIARSYELAFDMNSQSTQVRNGYFKEKKQYAIH